jgi:hypothetical protein
VPVIDFRVQGFKDKTLHRLEPSIINHSLG